MKISRNTHDQLIVENTPLMRVLFYAAAAVGVFSFGIYKYFTGASGAPFWFLICAVAILKLLQDARRMQTLFLRNTGEIILRKRSVLGYRQETHPLKHVARAIVETDRNSEHQRVHRVALTWLPETGIPPTPLAHVHDRFTDHDGLAAEINRWLDEVETP